MFSPEAQAKIQIWQAKSTDGSITPEELREAIIVLREARLSAAQSAGKAKSIKKPPVNTDALLDELKGL